MKTIHIIVEHESSYCTILINENGDQFEFDPKMNDKLAAFIGSVAGKY